MPRKRRAPLSPEQAAELIEQIADRIQNGDRSFDIQVQLNTASETLLHLQHRDGLLLLNRIGILLLTEDQTSFRYEYVQKRVASLPPLNRESDPVALRALAAELRTTRSPDA